MLTIRQAVVADLSDMRELLAQLGYDLAEAEVGRRFEAVIGTIRNVREQGERPVGRRQPRKPSLGPAVQVHAIARIALTWAGHGSIGVPSCTAWARLEPT